MKTKTIGLILTLFILKVQFSCSSNDVPLNDTIILNMEHVEGRWIEEKESEQGNIYIFKNDYSFFKAVNNPELIIFNTSGKYSLSNDTIKIVYQDMSHRLTSRTKAKIMYFKILALSNDELNINCIENNKTTFIRLKRQKLK